MYDGGKVVEILDAFLGAGLAAHKVSPFTGCQRRSVGIGACLGETLHRLNIRKTDGVCCLKDLTKDEVEAEEPLMEGDHVQLPSNSDAESFPPTLPST